MTAPVVKTEPGVRLEPQQHGGIKPDPELMAVDIKPEIYTDEEELYEDAGDLDISNGHRAVWLVKLPQFLAERWKDVEEDEEITLGIVKVDRNCPDQKNLKLFLEKNSINGEDIPIEYDLSITNMEVTNTYVFTEQDLPGYESKMETGVKDGDPAIPARLLYQNREREQQARDDELSIGDGKNGKTNNRYRPYIRKAIPKKTALVGTAKHECAVLPVYNEEYRQFQMKRTVREDAPKFSTKYLDNTTLASNLLVPGTAGAMQTSFSSFVKPSQPLRKTTDNKTFRIAKEDLVTSLFRHFETHEYWSMKAFREVTHQPEAYLKEVLEEIAIMNKTGPFSGKWSLRPEYKNMGPSDPATAGGGQNGSEPIDDEDDEEDEEVEMEDVVLGSEGQQN